MSIYQFHANRINGEDMSLGEYRGKVLLIVNTASNCGFTPQYAELEGLYSEFGREGFEVLGFPCNQFMGQEPGTEEDIQSFCQVNYGVTFPMFAKVDVKGEQAHPLFSYLSKEAPGILGSKSIKWNFTKFLIDREGNPVQRFAPNVKPSQFKEEIRKLLVK